MDNKSKTTRAKKNTTRKNTRAQKKQEVTTDKIIAIALYNKGNKTAVSYKQGNVFCSIFIDGIYKDRIEIEYKDGKLSKDNIIRITEI